MTLLALALMVLSGVGVAQNNTNSPYTRYGYGQLSDQGSGNSKGMGGIAYGLRDGSQINFVNPASYTAVDSLTFIFDGGISLQNTNFSNGTLKKNAKNSSFDYITMQFRASKWAAISLGMLPYSNVGYTMSSVREIDGVTYSGDGGLHQLYAGVGFKLWKDFSVGANFSYLWGDITHAVNQVFPSDASAFTLTRGDVVSVSSYKLDFGAQYTKQLGLKHRATLGVVFSPGHDINNDAYTQTTLGNSSYGYTQSVRDTAVTCGIPSTLGVGATYVYDNRLTVGMDFMLQKWSDVSFVNDKNAFCDRTKIAVGAEFRPDPMGRTYLGVVKYRLGAYYSQPYYKMEGERAATEFGVTAGLGFPVPMARSLISVSAQYVRTKGRKSHFLDENTFRICIGITFNERWFLKSKVQ